MGQRKKKIPPIPGFELQVTRCLVRATLASLVVLNVAELSQALAKPYARWFYSSWTVYLSWESRWFDSHDLIAPELSSWWLFYLSNIKEFVKFSGFSIDFFPFCLNDTLPAKQNAIPFACFVQQLRDNLH